MTNTGMPRRFGKNLVYKTIKGYHNLYLHNDVILLTDVLQAFRDFCMVNYR